MCDNYFTSHNLAVELIQKHLTILGTIRQHRKEIPTYLTNVRHLQQYDSRFVSDHNNAITMVTYIPKRYRSVTLLSSSHSTHDVDIGVKRKPQMILHYNKTKGGVDMFDEAIEEFTCRRKTSRWPLLLFFNCVDVAALNAFILMKRNGYEKSRAEFIRNLTQQLASNNVHHRVQQQQTPKDSKLCAEIIGFRIPQEPPPATQAHSQAKPGHCHKCHKSSRSRCSICSRICCPAHRVITKDIKCVACN